MFQSSSRTLAIAKRELGSAFTSPLAYLVGAVFLFLFGGLFLWGFQPGMEASMRSPFWNLIYALVLALSLLTMPLFSEEYARGTIETMMTAPITEMSLVLGKFFGVFGFFLVLLLGTVPHFVLLSTYGEPEMGQAMMGYFGLVLVGAMFISLGLFFSSLTRHQLLAAVLSILTLATFLLPPRLVDLVTYGWVNQLLNNVSVLGNFDSFAKGLIDTRPLVLFVTTTAFFLFLTVKVLESRRWR
jgi:ABC-2 type transport system permease protein